MQNKEDEMKNQCEVEGCERAKMSACMLCRECNERWHGVMFSGDPGSIDELLANFLMVGVEPTEHQKTVKELSDALSTTHKKLIDTYELLWQFCDEVTGKPREGNVIDKSREVIKGFREGEDIPVQGELASSTTTVDESPEPCKVEGCKRRGTCGDGATGMCLEHSSKWACWAMKEGRSAVRSDQDLIVEFIDMCAMEDGDEIDASFEVVSVDMSAKPSVSGYFTFDPQMTDSRPQLRTPAQRAKTAFDAYAAMDTPELPEDQLSALQVQLHRWEAREFGGGNVNDSTLGVNEELGELSDALLYLTAAQSGAGRLAHAVLKRGQGIRGFDDREKYKEEAADAIADVMIFAIQAATKLRLDAWELLSETATQVMGRRWSEDKEAAGKQEHFDRKNAEIDNLIRDNAISDPCNRKSRHPATFEEVKAMCISEAEEENRRRDGLTLWGQETHETHHVADEPKPDKTYVVMPPKCHECGAPLGPKYYSDVPDRGDICMNCHVPEPEKTCGEIMSEATCGGCLGDIDPAYGACRNCF